MVKMQPFAEVWRIFAEFGYFWSEFGDSFLFLSDNPARANGNCSDARLERLHSRHSVSIIVACRSVCFAKLFIIWTVYEICDEPERRCWPGVTLGKL